MAAPFTWKSVGIALLQCDGSRDSTLRAARPDDPGLSPAALLAVQTADWMRAPVSRRHLLLARGLQSRTNRR